MRETVGLLGTPIDVLDTQAVLARFEQFIQERRFHQVATANTDFLINGLTDPELCHILRNSDLVTPDGMPVVWASWLMGSPLPERVTGADLVPALVALAARKGYRIYMLGARPEVAQRARANLLAAHPSLQIVGCVSPPISPLYAMDSGAILDDIERAEPDILLVAFGNPKQEKWIHQNRERLKNVPICIGIGGTFDFLAGESPRAPEWMQRSGLEWIHRLVHEPRRLWRRYVRDLFYFSVHLLRQWWALRGVSGIGYSDVRIAQVEDGQCGGRFTVLSVVGDFKGEAVRHFQALTEEAFNAGTHLVLDFHAVTDFDATALGALILQARQAASRGCDVRLIAPVPSVAKALRRCHIDSSLYNIVPSVAQAFSQEHRPGLTWRVQCGEDAAVVTLSGTAEPQTVRHLERVCKRLLCNGKRIDLDARGLAYADTQLISTLYRLAASEEGPCRFRLIAGAVLYNALRREKALAKFVLMETPEPPTNAVEMSMEESETPSPLEAPLPLPSTAAYAPRMR